jgi:CBS domain containing-hemolysin-like protein
MEFMLSIIILVAVITLFVNIPIMIARSRGISGADLSTISILSWSALLLGITWVVALVLALVWQPKDDSSKKESSVDMLKKLHDLLKKGAISKKEFDSEKKKILNG